VILLLVLKYNIEASVNGSTEVKIKEKVHEFQDVTVVNKFR
jgi:hypothetical protein